MKLLLPLLSLTLFSCAHNKTQTNENNEIVKEVSKEVVVPKQSYGRVQKDIVDKRLPACENCIKGSSSHSELQASNKDSYYLYGAENLNLKNYYFDIPVVYNDQVRKWINYFTGRGRDWFIKYTHLSGRYAPVMSKILAEKGMPRDLIYLAMAESGFQNQAKSWASAVGPWQFMSFTGRKYGLNIDFFQDERRDPIKATHASANYLKDLYQLFGSWELAAAGYNAGEGKIGRAIRRYGTRNFWQLARGRYLRPETKNYVPKIMALAIIGKNLKSFGFEDVTFDETLDYDVIETKGSVDLYSVADVLGTSFEELKRYNPELIRWQTPVTAESYNLKVPVGLKKKWNQLADKTVVAASKYKTYQTRGYSELNHISRMTRVPVEVLAHLNQMAPNQRLFPNTLVLLPFREDHSDKDQMYADLYQKSRRGRGSRRGNQYQNWLERGYAKGQQISRPREYYVVQKGDTLWDVARKTGVSINTIIKSNYRLVKNRMIVPGDKLAIR